MSSVDPAYGVIEMDKETFRIMWDLSTPGSDAAGCFMRLQMASYAGYQLEKPSVLEFMPDVSRTLLFYQMI